MEILRNVVASRDSFSLEFLCGARVDMVFDPSRLVEPANRSRLVLSPSTEMKIRMGLYPRIEVSEVDRRSQYCSKPHDSFNMIRYPVYAKGHVDVKDVYLRLSSMGEGERFADYLAHDLFPRSNRTLDKAELDRLKGSGKVQSVQSVGRLFDGMGYLWYDSASMLEDEYAANVPIMGIMVYSSFLGTGFINTHEISRGQMDYVLASRERC